MSEVQIYNESRRRVLTVYADVASAPPLPMPYSRPEIQLDPDRVSARFARTDEKDWKLQNVYITGTRLLKSGERGQNQHLVRWLANLDDPIGLPQWAADWVKSQTPVEGQRQ